MFSTEKTRRCKSSVRTNLCADIELVCSMARKCVEETVEDKFKRINILIRPDQHRAVLKSGLSLSGLVRDLLDDRFNDSKITISMSERSKRLYDHIVSNYGVGDDELERFFVEALDRFLDERSKEIDTLRAHLKDVQDT